MPATKAILWVVVLGAGVACLVFIFKPEWRPPLVQSWIDTAGGFTPAKTPSEAMEKFRECIRKRNYKTASKYVGGEYREYFSMAADSASKLADAVDDLLYNVTDVAHLNSPDGKYVLDSMQPFPKDFTFDVKPVSDKEYRALAQAFPKDFPSDSMKVLGDKAAVGQITFELAKPGDPKAGRISTTGMDQRIFLALVPLGLKWDGLVGLKEEGNDKEKGWKIYFPMTPDVREKVDYLKSNYGNYTQALSNIKYSIKHDAAGKTEFEGELAKQLNNAK
jgi:hypothetical protein